MNRTVIGAIARHRDARPDQLAVLDAHGELTYGALLAAIDERVEYLRAAGTRVLAVDLDNGIDWIAWDLGAASAGVACVPLPPFFTAAQREHVLARAGVDAIVGADGLRRLDNPPAVLPAGTAKVTFTSGTTGTPKGVCLPMDCLERVASSIVDVVGPATGSRHFSALPMSILLENVAGVYATLMAGCTVVTLPRAALWTNPVDLLGALTSSRAATVILVPELLRGLMAVMSATGSALPHLAFVAVGGARVSPDLIRAARGIGLPVFEGYGLSECGSVVALNTAASDRPGTVGRVLEHVALTVAGGEIVIANPGALGYLGSDGSLVPLRTGDLGALDDDGFLSVTGRSGNVVITAWGRNVSPEWVEAELLAQPGIQQATVLGDGLPTLGAAIASTADESAIDRAVAAANTRLPEYARVGAWLRVDPFTVDNGLLTGTGRTRRGAITERYASELELMMTQTTPFYDRLVEATAGARQELYQVPQLVDGLAGRISRSTYIAYLTEAYHHVRHTVPFLMAMGARLGSDRQRLQQAAIDYINEEKGHEQWILKDIDAAGGDAEAARRSTPRLPTEVLISYNYDYIARKNPVGFLGMVFMLESTSTQVATRGAIAIQGALDLPDGAFSYLYSHGSLDQEHMKFFRDQVNRIDDTDDQQAIIEVARNSFLLFAAVLRAIPHEREVKHVA